MSKNQSGLSLKNRVAYAGTDAAGNLLYCTLTSFINYYHTDVFGISIGTAAVIALLVRIINTATVPLWGITIDKTKSKYGKSRPWFARLAIPFAVFMALTFFTPGLRGTSKVIYAGFTYLTASILYTGISTPITSILPNLSNDSYERTKLNSFRMIGGNVGYFITATFTLTLVSVLGQGNRQRGFFCTVLIYAVVSAAMFFFAFKNTKEVNMEDADKSLPIKDCFKALKSNWPWVIVVIGSMFYWLGNSTRTSSLIYYSRYYLKCPGFDADDRCSGYSIPYKKIIKNSNNDSWIFNCIGWADYAWNIGKTFCVYSRCMGDYKYWNRNCCFDAICNAVRYSGLWRI